MTQICKPQLRPLCFSLHITANSCQTSSLLQVNSGLYGRRDVGQIPASHSATDICRQELDSLSFPVLPWHIYFEIPQAYTSNAQQGSPVHWQLCALILKATLTLRACHPSSRFGPMTACWLCSLGMLMWSMAEGTAPFNDVPDEVQLHWLRVIRFPRSEFCQVLILILTAFLLISLFCACGSPPIADQLLYRSMTI